MDLLQDRYDLSVGFVSDPGRGGWNHFVLISSRAQLTNVQCSIIYNNIRRSFHIREVGVYQLIQQSIQMNRLPRTLEYLIFGVSLFLLKSFVLVFASK